MNQVLSSLAHGSQPPALNWVCRFPSTATASSKESVSSMGELANVEATFR